VNEAVKKIKDFSGWFLWLIETEKLFDFQRAPAKWIINCNYDSPYHALKHYTPL